ncbi:MAG: hypothetical protein H7122_09400 [Chitinophagaceae bacterium]|nr:hypothetical protein [Chitinophagaceae bacterium]
MQDFMLIFRGGSDASGLSPDEMQNHMQKWFVWVDELKKKDIYVGGEALTPAGKTIAGKKALITDGPYAESKELVGGYFVVKAASLDAAVEIAKNGYPDFIFNGAVEVREVAKFDGM